MPCMLELVHLLCIHLFLSTRELCMPRITVSAPLIEEVERGKVHIIIAKQKVVLVFGACL